jgi:hypothetical protein
LAGVFGVGVIQSGEEDVQKQFGEGGAPMLDIVAGVRPARYASCSALTRWARHAV